jgi:hypothetical protein
MTREELEHELQTVQEELEEVDEMRQAVLGQTGVHVGVRLLQQYRARFDRDQARFEKRLAEIRAELAALEQEQPH